jgi:hypothetical protein
MIMAIPRQALGALLLLAAGCVTSPWPHGAGDKLRGMTQAATPEPVNEGQITPQNAHAQAQALAEEMDRDEKELAEPPKEAKAYKH